MEAVPTIARRSVHRLRPVFPNGLDAAQAVLVVVALLQFLRCSGPAYLWVGVGLSLPFLRCVFSGSFRRRVVDQVKCEWAKCEAFTLQRDCLPWRAAAILIVLPAALFYLSQRRPLMTGDSKPIALIACALVRDGSTEISAFAPTYAKVYGSVSPEQLPYFCRRTPTGVYSAYHSGMFVFAVPSAALAHLFGADLASGGVQDRLEKGVASCLAALCLGLFFLLALHLADARAAGWMTLFLATASGLCSTVGQALWQHGGVLFWMLSALLIEFRTWRRPSTLATVLQGVALAMAFACRLPSALLIASFGVWLLFRAPSRALLVGLVAIVAYAPWAWYYHSVYGHILGPSIRQADFFTGHWRDSLIPLLFSPDHGLLIYQPWILLLLTCALPSVRRSLTVPADVPCGYRWLCAAVIALSFALIASWYCWWGGQCWGSRLLVETVPFLALLCLPFVSALHPLRWGRRLLWATMIIGTLVHLPGVYFHADFRDCQPALIGTQHEPPGSWSHVPFLTPFVGSLHGYH